MKVGITGINGKMGKNIAIEILKNKDFQLIGGLVRSEHIEIGMDIGEYFNQEKTNTFITDDLEKFFDLADIVIDFSSAELTLKCAKLASEKHKILISGTTGLKDNDLNKLKEYSKNCVIVWSSNMSIGVNLLLNFVEQASKILYNYDAEVLDMHHRLKKDLPSGTALSFGKAIANGRGWNFEDVKSKERDGIVGVRKQEEIGFATLRGGNVAGEHTIIFADDDERIEFTHKASSRSIFVKGAVKASLWSIDKKNGFYTMKDVLEFYNI